MRQKKKQIRREKAATPDAMYKNKAHEQTRAEKPTKGIQIKRDIIQKKQSILSREHHKKENDGHHQYEQQEQTQSNIQDHNP